MPISDAMIKAANDAAAKAWHTGGNMTIAMLTAAFSASPSDAERHERGIPVAYVPQAVIDSLGRGFSGLYEMSKNAAPGHRPDCTVPLYAAPPSPPSVQEPVAVKAMEWVEASSGYWKAHSVGGRYSTYRVSYALGFDLRRDGESIGEYHLSLEAAKSAAQADYEKRIRSALSTSQSDPAPEIAALRAENERLKDKADGLESDLDSAVEVAFGRGAHDWTRLNYPTHFERLSSTAVAPEQEESGS